MRTRLVRLLVPFDPTSLEKEKVTTRDADARRGRGDLVMDAAGAEAEGGVREWPAQAVGGDARALADGNE